MFAAPLTRRSAARACASLLLVLAVGYVAIATERAGAQPPPIGAYQEPAPSAPNETHATDFVNELLKARGVTKRVTTPDLRGGIVLKPANRPSGAATPKPSGKPKPSVKLPRPDAGPAERAGLGGPADQDVPGVLLGLVVGVILAAVGVVLEITGRRRRKA